MKIAVFATRFPYPLEKGDKLRLYHQIAELSKWHEIHLFALCETIPTQEEIAELSQFTSSLKYYHLGKSWKYFNAIIGIFKFWPMQCSIFYTSSTHRSFRKDVKKLRPDVVYFQLVRSTLYSGGMSFPKVLDYMDAFGVSMEKRGKIEKFPSSVLYKIESKLMKRYEKKVYKDFVAHTVITQEDARQLSLSKNDCVIVPNGIDLNYFIPNETTSKEYDLCFVGNMSYLPNIEAAEYLATEILPLFLSKNIHVKLLIAGAAPHKRVLKLKSENVVISGWMDDIREAYWKSKIFVAPIFQGTGLQNKILESMACGIPVITTENVNKGIEARPDTEILIANSAEIFFEKIVHLLEYPQNNLAQNALNMVQTRFSWEKCTKILSEVFENIEK